MNNKTIKLTLVTLLLGTTLVSAKNNNFEEKKQIMLKHLSKKIELTTVFKNCISDSNSGKAMKVCRQNYKSSMKQLREDTKSKKSALKKK